MCTGLCVGTTGVQVVVVVHSGLQGLEELPSCRTAELFPFFASGFPSGSAPD